MDCPKSYSNKYVMDLIIKPSLKELQKYFTNLQCTVKYAYKRGNPVAGYIFTFKPEQPPKAIMVGTQATIATTLSRPPSKGVLPSSQEAYPKNQFNRFMEREVTQEELNEMERQLLQYQINYNGVSEMQE